MNEVPGTLGERLRMLLDEADMRQAELATKLAVSDATVSQWLSGKKGVSSQNLQELANALGTTPEFLAQGKRDWKSQLKALQRKVKWVFRLLPADGARQYGSADVWTIAWGIGNFVREALQNVLDAMIGDSVEVTFRLYRLRGAALQRYLTALRWDPEDGGPGLKAHLEAAADGGQK